ncbi:MAG: hypothetical protein QUV71_14530 [Rhizobium sp.]|nr:hypothetical protein [Rhizobium sp.]MDM8014218.1 hypothetical protein [Rhizobium sp.]
MNAPNWKTAALEDLKGSSLSIRAVASKHGRSESAIKRLIKDQQICRAHKGQNGGLKRFIEMDALSADHRRLGLHLIRCRGNEEKTSFANALGLSAIRLGQMEAGRHDFTLSEMQNISQLVGERIFELRAINSSKGGLAGTLH